MSSAGRDGKDFFKALSRAAQQKVGRFCDLNEAKLGGTYNDASAPRDMQRFVPVVHVDDLKVPVVTCVALDRYPEFEARLAAFRLRQGVEYYHFA